MRNGSTKPLGVTRARRIGCAMASCLAILSTEPAHAAVDGLKAVEDALATVRQHPGTNRGRDAGPELTGVKNALRLWLEPALAEMPTNNNPPAQADRLSQRLSSELIAAGMTCGDEPAGPCQRTNATDFNARGFLGPVRVSYLDYGRYLLVTTEVGVLCGYDQSAYVYGHDSGKWSLLFASEQDDYGDKHYSPQNFLRVQVSPSNTPWDKPAPAPLVLTLGYSPWCQSNWQMLYSRLWRADPSHPSRRPLIDRSDSLYMGDDPAVAEGSVTNNDVVIEWRGQSADSGVLIRPHVLHYLIGKDDQSQRIGPVALDPSSFVDEWLNSAWRDAESWTAPTRKTALGLWHKRLHSALVLGEFDGPALRCRRDPSLWQVSFAATIGDLNHMRDGPMAYYLVRWTPPYRFSLVGASLRRAPNCDQPVAMPDNLGTLFPLQGWRGGAALEP